jgi:hypothetical protein
MLAMKLLALRLDPASDRYDLDDILNLMQVVGLHDKSQIVGFAARFYPEARISGKLPCPSITCVARIHKETRARCE